LIWKWVFVVFDFIMVCPGQFRQLKEKNDR